MCCMEVEAECARGAGDGFRLVYRLEKLPFNQEKWRLNSPCMHTSNPTEVPLSKNSESLPVLEEEPEL